MRLLLVLVFFIITSACFAQQTYVPDDIFEDYLENNGMGNGIPNDDYVTTANISGVGSLIVWGWNIADLTGIEDFASLTQLFCFDNLLTSLDVTQNTNLSDLRCNNNQLTSLDLSQNTVLTQVFCDNNQIASLDFSQNPIVNDIRCFDNNLTSINVTQNANLNTLICNDNQLTSIDVTQNPNLSNFRCFDNNITALDVTQNAALGTFFCYDNQLTTLDVTQNPNLLTLFCWSNDLTSIDVTQNSLLEDLRCNNNDLTSLDVSQNPALVTLICNDNQLECLNANNGQNISLFCTNNMLSCVSVVYPPWTVANASFDPGVTFDVLCQTIIDNDVDQLGTLLTAVQNDATYQWFNCAFTDGDIPGETNQSFNATTTGYYAVQITYSDPCGGVYVDTSSCHLVDYSGLEELEKGTLELVRITDLMGRETNPQSNTPLIYYYSDGTIERVFRIEE